MYAFSIFVLLVTAILALGFEKKIIQKTTTTSEVGKYLRNHVFKTTTGAVDPQQCLADCWDENQRCQSFNFFPDTKVCELNTKTHQNAPDDYITKKTSVYCINPGFGLKLKMPRHDMKRPAPPKTKDACASNPCQNNGKCVSNTKTGFHCTNCNPGFHGKMCEQKEDPCLASPCYNGGECISTAKNFTCGCSYWYEGRHCEDKVGLYRNCLELQSKNGVTTDGEYKLHLSFPTCNKTVDVYCDNMNTTNPREFITLKAGEEKNYSTKDWRGSHWENEHPSGTTRFAKIGIHPDLSVRRHEHKFARITWSYNGEKYFGFATSADCVGVCDSERKGIFKMDLTGTGLRFVTPILWKFSGSPDCQGIMPTSYEIDEGNQVVSGKCGGMCGNCKPINLNLEIVGCE